MDKPYEILDLDKDSSKEEIRQSYREKVLEVHPDVGGSIDEFEKVRNAYLNLIDKDKTNSSKNRNYSDWDYSVVQFLDYQVLENNNWNISENNLFERARNLNLTKDEYGEILVPKDKKVLKVAEKEGYNWPFSCRGGACANCCVKIVQGDITTPKYAILSEELLDKGFRLSCIGKPKTRKVKLIYNVKSIEKLSHLLLPSRQ